MIIVILYGDKDGENESGKKKLKGDLFEIFVEFL